jgi:hypothetical protein
VEDSDFDEEIRPHKRNKLYHMDVINSTIDTNSTIENYINSSILETNVNESINEASSSNNKNYQALKQIHVSNNVRYNSNAHNNAYYAIEDTTFPNIIGKE